MSAVLFPFPGCRMPRSRPEVALPSKGTASAWADVEGCRARMCGSQQVAIIREEGGRFFVSARTALRSAFQRIDVDTLPEAELWADGMLRLHKFLLAEPAVVAAPPVEEPAATQEPSLPRTRCASLSASGAWSCTTSAPRRCADCSTWCGRRWGGEFAPRLRGARADRRAGEGGASGGVSGVGVIHIPTLLARLTPNNLF